MSRSLLVQAERSLKHDPRYALRLLVDIGLRALSPAMNDPTTAVRALDEIEGVLRRATALPLGPVELPAGEGTLVLPSATWCDIVDLALLEIFEAGITAPQTTRRISALLADLLDDIDDAHDVPLLRYRRRLVPEVSSRVPEGDRATWLTGDRQRLGGLR